MEIIDSTFEVDRKFQSLDEAYQFLRREYVQELPTQVGLQQPSGLVIPQPQPKYIFRGECGQYPTTVAGQYRPNLTSLSDGKRITSADRESVTALLPTLADRFTRKDYSMDGHFAIGLLQHYGFPTRLVDFTSDPGHAITFAAAGEASIARVCVLPTDSMLNSVSIINLTEHPWCERPRRQSAFAVILPRDCRDFKDRELHSVLRSRWYEFPISDEDRALWRERHIELLRLDNDPSAGFIRHHITEYVETNGKLSPRFTEWLLERIPIMPRCAEVMEFDGTEVVVDHRSPSLVGNLDSLAEENEKNWSRRYWSTQFLDSSRDRMKNFAVPPVGALYADPRTWHGAQINAG